ncbi:FecR family protein [Xanthomonas hortorum]|uniref:FecR domain-containing protein n=1 Tax=Xanthomonas hortorum pv. hederae TaxID=453603 RepID=A0A9X4BV59_9XANT|nr:FecR domain-containing protein [Xanthomonas hortorum]MCE4369693.1 FecR domain-containing protein [Xanthomonas hortorum pv. hederae]MDC8640160.1 FecR domain-containing protein [Xanthomonas hortorum pv. hederae]
MTDDSDRIAQQAAAYLARSRDETPAQRQEREAWLAADARHAREYERLRRVEDRMAGLMGDDPDLQALDAKDIEALVRARRMRRGCGLWAAAILVLSLVGTYALTSFPVAPAPLSYATAVGERRTEALADGTRMVLNTDSALEVRYTRARRGIRLERGEVQFEVARDSARPFVVRLGEATVTAVGTRFQVRHEAGESVVTLLQGAVDVAQGPARRSLRPNEQARLSSAGIAVRTIDPARADGWLDGWLRFHGTPLAEVVAETNRYAARKLRLADPAVAGLELSGNFHAGDSASVASAVELMLPVRADDTGTDIVLRAR